MALKDRVRRLENADGDECSVCGWPNVTFNLVWRDAQTSAEETSEPEREPKYCPDCGRETRITLEWGDSLLMPEETTTKEMTMLEREKIDAALEHHETEQAKLLRPDGSKRFSDAEHNERENALKTNFHGALDSIEADISRQIASAEEDLLRVEHANPADSLTPEELQRAGAALFFAREDAESLPLEELTGRCRAALTAGDRVSMFLLSRYAGRRVGEAQPSNPYDQDESAESSGSSPGGAAAQELREVVAEMEKALRPDHERRLSEARAAVEEATEAKSYVYLRRRGAKSPVELHLNAAYGHIG